jgi:hypothetical protein
MIWPSIVGIANDVNKKELNQAGLMLHLLCFLVVAAQSSSQMDLADMLVHNVCQMHHPCACNRCLAVLLILLCWCIYTPWSVTARVRRVVAGATAILLCRSAAKLAPSTVASNHCVCTTLITGYCGFCSYFMQSCGIACIRFFTEISTRSHII